jgi:GT2 family glycosyltransferase
MRKRLLVAIPNYMKEDKDLKMLLRCISSLRLFEPLMIFHVVVFDDCSPYFTETAMYEILSSGTKIIRQDENGGYSKIVNRAFHYARENKYDFMLTLNSDCEILTPFYKRIVQLFNYDEKIAVIGGLCLYPSGRIQSAGFHADSNGVPVEIGKRKHYILDENHGANKSRYIYGVTGAFQFIDVEAAFKIGLYSENYKMSYEDVEFCQRVWLSGYRCFYDALIATNHCESATRGSYLGPQELQSLEQWHLDFSEAKLQQVNDSLASANLESQNQSS